MDLGGSGNCHRELSQRIVTENCHREPVIKKHWKTLENVKMTLIIARRCEKLQKNSQKARRFDTWSKKGVERLGFLRGGRPRCRFLRGSFSDIELAPQ